MNSIAFSLAPLEPILEMLKARESVLPKPEWHTLVLKTRESILRNPEQYLGTRIQPSEGLSEAIQEMFNRRLN